MDESVLKRVEDDCALAEEASSAGLDAGAIPRDALRRLLRARRSTPDQTVRAERFRREHADAIASRNEAVDRDGLFGEEWRPF